MQFTQQLRKNAPVEQICDLINALRDYNKINHASPCDIGNTVFHLILQDITNIDRQTTLSKHLIENGANPGILNDRSVSPLGCALSPDFYRNIYNENLAPSFKEKIFALLDMLIEANPDCLKSWETRAYPPTGNTVLHDAAAPSRLSIFLFLLKHRYRFAQQNLDLGLYQKNNSGYTPIELFLRNGGQTQDLLKALSNARVPNLTEEILKEWKNIDINNSTHFRQSKLL